MRWLLQHLFELGPMMAWGIPAATRRRAHIPPPSTPDPHPLPPTRGPTRTPTVLAPRSVSGLKPSVAAARTGLPELAHRYIEDPRTNRPDPRTNRNALKQALKQVASSIDDPAQRAAALRLVPDAIVASRKSGVPASVLLAVSGQESTYGTNLGPSSAGARGVSQFIPSTRDTMIAKYGVDPWKNSKSGLLAAGLYLKELGFKNDPQGALSSYSGGYAASAYNNPILSNARNFTALDKVAGGKAKVSSGRHKLSTNELFYDPGISLKDGQPIGPIGGHDTHVHYGSERPRDILIAAKLAERRGLNVSENPLFGGVEPVHVTNSLHYQSQRLPRKLVPLAKRLGGSGRQIGEAIDVSGSAAQLASLDKALARRSGQFVSGLGGASYSSGGGAAYGAPVGGGTASSAPSGGRRAPVASRGGLSTLGRSLLPEGVTPGQRAAKPTDEIAATDADLAALSNAAFRPRRRLRTR